MCDSRTKKLTHRPEKIPLKKVKKSAWFLFLPVKIWSMLFFWSFTFIFHKNPGPCRIPGQLSKVKSRSPGQVFLANPGGCPGVKVPSWNWLRHYFAPLWSSLFFGNYSWNMVWHQFWIIKCESLPQWSLFLESNFGPVLDYCLCLRIRCPSQLYYDFLILPWSWVTLC